MKKSDMHKQIRKPVAPPTQRIEGQKQKDAYKRKEKFKKSGFSFDNEE